MYEKEDRMKKRLVLLCVFCLSLILVACESKEGQLDPKNPTIVSFCAYYNDVQLKELTGLVNEFNETEGKEKGVIVEPISIPSVKSLNQYLIDSANDQAGSEKFPNIFITYRSVIPQFNGRKKVIDFKKYFEKEEINAFIENFAKEGYFKEDKDALFMLPMGSSTELLYINKTDFEKFLSKHGEKLKDSYTYDDLLELAKLYYEDTDSETPDIPHDGKILLGFDGKANHLLASLEALGYHLIEKKGENYEVNFTEEIAEKIWELYIVPTLKGYIGKQSKFISGDLKSGKVLMSIASTSSATYNSEVVIDEKTDEQREIELAIRFSPAVAGKEPVYIQQGGGIFITETNRKEELASVEFIRWLTNKENNMEFALKCSYMPVRKDNTELNYLKENMQKLELDKKVKDSILTSIEQVKNSKIYVRPYFEGYEDIRTALVKAVDVEVQEARNELMEKFSKGADYETLVANAVGEEGFKKWYQDIRGKLRVKVK